MTPILRSLACLVATAVVIGFGAVSIAAYRPGGIGASAIALADLRHSLNSLEARELDSAARLAAYRDGLIRADASLSRALRSNPADAASIERMAMVRWESSVLAGEPDADSVLSLVRIAAARAPRVPDIQADLGALLYKTGNPVEAAPFMRRAVELSPIMTNRVVTSMQDVGVDPQTIARELPRTARVLILLREDFTRFAHLEEWLLSAEELLPTHPRELLWSYTYACLQANAEDRLLEHLERLGVLTEGRAEAERQIAIGRAQLARHEPARAASAAATARILAPTDFDVLEFAGQIALAAGESAEAEAAFDDALGALAIVGSNATVRARLYRQRGQALERLGRVDNAFDDYRRAANILPDDPWLQERFATVAPKPQPESRQ